MFSDAYNKEIQQFRHLIEQYESETIATQNSSNPADYQLKPGLEPVEVLNPMHIYSRLNIGKLFVISILIAILLMTFQAGSELWCYTIYADSLIPQ